MTSQPGIADGNYWRKVAVRPMSGVGPKLTLWNKSGLRRFCCRSRLAISFPFPQLWRVALWLGDP